MAEISRTQLLGRLWQVLDAFSMLTISNIAKWLDGHCLSKRQLSGEILYEHLGGRRSVLLDGSPFAGTLPSSGGSFISRFYDDFNGGAIGDGYLLIGSPSGGNESTGTGIRVPSLEEIRSIAESSGMVFEPTEIPFMTTGYMFVYAMASDGRLLCHDRDCLSVTADQSIADILNSWWEIRTTDSHA